MIVRRRPFFEDSINAHRWNLLEISWFGHISSRGEDGEKKKKALTRFIQFAVAFGMEDFGNLRNEKGKIRKRELA